MVLHFHKVNRRSKDLQRIRKLYRTAFPPEERAPFHRLIKGLRNGLADCWSIRHEEEWVGFVYAICDSNLVYLFFFAIDDPMRGKGYGHKVMAALKEHYQGKTIFLAREPLDPSADNAEQRLRRHAFYLSCGMVDLPRQIIEFGFTYDVMSSGKMVDPEDYHALMLAYCGPRVCRLMQMQ